jgi:hypothetical protein
VLSLKRLRDIVADITPMRQKESRRDFRAERRARRLDRRRRRRIETFMEHVGASQILVSGQGVREGIASAC